MSKSITSTNLTLNVQMPSSLINPNLTFSYFIFNPASAGFIAYGGGYSQYQFQGSFLADLHKSIAYTPNILFGISSLQLSTTNDVLVSSSIDSDFIYNLTSVTVVQAIQLFYIVVGMTSTSSCNQS